MDTALYLRYCQKRVNKTLHKILPSSYTQPRPLHQAMRYAVLNGGKRLRSALIYATGEGLLNKKNNINHLKALDTCSAVVELVHTFSLIHDDLPAIDNDDLRRGKPACHKAFGEAVAILAGDALLSLSFETLASINPFTLNAETVLKMVQLLGHYVGSCGMAGGETLDVLQNNQNLSLAAINKIYQLKTSYLLCASILMGAMAVNCQDPETLHNLEKFGLYLGMAFQIHDDIIGIEQSTAILGKPQGSDIIKNKPTIPYLMGLKQAKNQEQKYFELSTKFLKKSGIKTDKLLEISYFVIKRNF